MADRVIGVIGKLEVQNYFFADTTDFPGHGAGCLRFLIVKQINR